MADTDSPGMPAPLLSLRGVGVGAGGVELLAGIDLDLHAGEMVAVTGPSGCGKTTLLRAVCGLDDPTAGTVLLEGRTADEWGWPVYRRRVLLVDQRPALLDATVEANLRRPFAYRAASGAAFPAERARAAMDAFGVGAERLSQDARSLSVGQQQRVCLIRALLLDPAVLLMDEPTSALDADTVSLVENAVRSDIVGRGAAALIVTHDRAQAERWCDRRIDLRDYVVEAAVGGKEGSLAGTGRHPT